MFVYFNPLCRQNDMPVDPSLPLSVFLFSLYGLSVFCVCFFGRGRGAITYPLFDHASFPSSQTCMQDDVPTLGYCFAVCSAVLLVLFSVILHRPKLCCAVLCSAPLRSPLYIVRKCFLLQLLQGSMPLLLCLAWIKLHSGKKTIVCTFWYCCIRSEGGLKMVINENVQQILVGKLF